MIIFLCAVPAAFWLGRSAAERGLLLAATLAVLAVEVLNSSLESLCDLVSPQHHPLAGRAKDLGSAAVLLTILCAVLIWGGVLWDRFVP